MEEIDWSKAPEGATHWEPESDEFSASWMRQAANTRWEYWNGACWMGARHVEPGRIARMVRRPVAWTGEGLPPVGTVCEVDYCEEWQRCEIIAHFRQPGGMVAAFTVEIGDGAKGLDAYAEGYFRPIRTPEQIALEERNQRVSEIMGIVKGLDLRFLTESHAHHVAVALYDAGLRFPEGGAQ